MTSPDPDDISALTTGAGAVDIARDAVAVHGPDATTYLQGQLSQDVLALVDGASALSFLLQPQGRLVALVRVTRTHAGAFVLDTDAGWGEAVIARLARFKLRTKVEIEAVAGQALALRGAAVPATVEAGDGLVVEAPWPGFSGLDLLALSPVVPVGIRRCQPTAYESLRVAAGVPVMGVDLDDRTIPAETGLVDLAASFTKGCYTGQELVARMDSRAGSAPRPLRRLRGSGAPPAVGTEVSVGDKVVGTLTSVAPAPTGDGWVAIGPLKREAVPGGPTQVGGTDVEVVA